MLTLTNLILRANYTNLAQLLPRTGVNECFNVWQMVTDVGVLSDPEEAPKCHLSV